MFDEIGQSGTGKSYTLSFSKLKKNENLFDPLIMPDWVCIVPRLLCKLFANKGIQLSMIQLYQSKAFDLFNKNKAVKVSQKADDALGDQILVTVSSYSEAIEVFYNGINERRNVSKTVMNSVSSRSHAILEIVLRNSGNYISKFTIADLAGTENRRKNLNTQTCTNYI